MLITTFLFGCSLARKDAPYLGNKVAIAGTKGQWKIMLNGEPFELKGVGVSQNFGSDGQINYLKLAKEMGSNCVRTWGIDQGNTRYLNEALKHRLLVDAGIWTEWVNEKKTCSYVKNDICKNKLRQKALKYIQKNKDHPSILFWNIGNETFAFTKDETERIAFAKFLEKLIQDVKKIDPYHPIIYTSAYTTALKYIKQYVPSLDIFGVNIYGGFEHMHQQVSSTLDIPYIITEYGPLGPWDRKKDVNGRPSEATDRSKTHNYKMLFRSITQHKGYCLGGFIFLLGDTTQNSSTWWNLTYRQYTKLPYLAVQSLFTEQPVTQKIPHVNYLTVSKRKDLNPNELFTVEVHLDSNSPSDLQYHYFASTDIDHLLEEYPNTEFSLEIEGTGSIVKIKAPSDPGVYRIYAVVTDSNKNASTLSKSISISLEEK